MLKQMARRCRLLAILHDNEFTSSLLQTFNTILEPGDSTKPPLTQELSSSATALLLSKAPKMQDCEYQSIKQYLHSTGRPYRSYTDLPHPEYALILPPNAKRATEFHENGRTYSCHLSHSGNSSIQFHNPQTQTRLTGAIETILEIPLEGFLRRFILARTYHPLNDTEAALTPYPQFPRFQSQVVNAALSAEVIVIEPHHIITHLTTFRRPAGTYSISHEILVICWALNRGLK